MARGLARNGYSCETGRKKKWRQSFVVKSSRFMHVYKKNESNGRTYLRSGRELGCGCRFRAVWRSKGDVIIALANVTEKGYGVLAELLLSLELVGVLAAFLAEPPCLLNLAYSFLSIASKACTVGSASFRLVAV